MERISFHRLAHREVSEAGEFYQLESPGLGVAFLDEVEFCTQAILQHPEAGQLIVGNVRRRLFRRFPYALLYSIKSDHIRILAVMNLKRRPMYWVGRK
jgi:plasmid stabilization system protein ParE